jgi:hypothetical protein
MKTTRLLLISPLSLLILCAPIHAMKRRGDELTKSKEGQQQQQPNEAEVAEKQKQQQQVSLIPKSPTAVEKKKTKLKHLEQEISFCGKLDHDTDSFIKDVVSWKKFPSRAQDLLHFMWVFGRPGNGKTMLINHLADKIHARKPIETKFGDLCVDNIKARLQNIALTEEGDQLLLLCDTPAEDIKALTSSRLEDPVPGEEPPLEIMFKLLKETKEQYNKHFVIAFEGESGPPESIAREIHHMISVALKKDEQIAAYMKDLAKCYGVKKHIRSATVEHAQNLTREQINKAFLFAQMEAIREAKDGEDYEIEEKHIVKALDRMTEQTKLMTEDDDAGDLLGGLFGGGSKKDKKDEKEKEDSHSHKKMYQ